MIVCVRLCGVYVSNDYAIHRFLKAQHGTRQSRVQKNVRDECGGSPKARAGPKSRVAPISLPSESDENTDSEANGKLKARLCVRVVVCV